MNVTFAANVSLPKVHYKGIYVQLIRVTTHNEAKELHKCDLCSSEFALKQTLQRHKRQVHGGRKSFKCQICGIDFSRAKLTHAEKNFNTH